MILTKVVPEHTVTLKLSWLDPDFAIMSQKYRNIRKRAGEKDPSCYWCGHSFADGEMIALAGRSQKTNVTLCQTCVDQIERKP